MKLDIRPLSSELVYNKVNRWFLEEARFRMSFIKLITSQLLDECIEHIRNADTVYLLISFVMESGVRLLSPHLRDAVLRGADVKLLTGDYLYVTQPQALTALIHIHPELEVRLWNSRGVSFHPKAYLFRKANGDDVVIVGSSNLSHSALTTAPHRPGNRRVHIRRPHLWTMSLHPGRHS